jgi:opacity protein-like surface antigen
MKIIRCFLALAFVVAAVPAFADGDITLFGAAQHQGKLTVQAATSAATTSKTFDPATFGAFGIRIGQGKAFGSEHNFEYAPNFLESNTKAFIYNSNVLVQAPVPKLKPYGTAGLGTIITFGTDSSGRPSYGKIGTKLALNYGGGLKVLPAGGVGIRFDIRGYLIPSAKFNVAVPTVTDPLATIKSQSQTLNILEAGFGVIFAFGGGK